MPYYEHVFLTRQDVSQQQVDSLKQQFQSVITDNGGNVGKTEYWGLKSLTYKIKKNRKAHFTFMNLDAPHAAVAEMERQMSINADIIRFMTIKVDELDENQSAMMRKNEERRGRKEHHNKRPPRHEQSESNNEAGGAE